MENFRILECKGGKVLLFSLAFSEENKGFTLKRVPMEGLSVDIPPRDCRKLLRFTGFTDRSNKPIYEGQKVLFHGQECEIALEMGSFCVVSHETIEKPSDWQGICCDNAVPLIDIKWNEDCQDDMSIDALKVVGYSFPTTVSEESEELMVLINHFLGIT